MNEAAVPTAERPLMVSVTELQDFMRCHRAWDITSPNRQGLTKRGIPKIEFHVGSATHHGISAPVFGMEPQEALEDWFTQEHRRIALDYRAKVKSPMSSVEVQALNDSKTLVKALVAHYFRTYGSNPIRPYRYIAAELSFRIPLPQIGPHVYLVGTFDGVAIGPDGRIYLVERKTYSQKPDVKWLGTDHQLTGYCFALQTLTGRPVAGILYDGIMKKLPKTPRLLTTGFLSQEWTDTTEFAYEEALVAHYGANWREQTQRTAQGRLPTPLPEIYDPFLDRLRERDRITDLWQYTTPFFTRQFVPVVQHAVRQWGIDMLETISEIASGPRIYPNFTWSGCWDCFTEGHRILKASSRTAVPIEKLKVGEWLLGYNEATGQTEPTQIVHTQQREATGFLRIYFLSGRVVRCTPEHPFFVEKRNGWVAANLLTLGDEVHANHEGRQHAPAGECDSCGLWHPALEQDHRVAYSNGGLNDVANLQWLCGRCHVAKSATERGSTENHRAGAISWHARMTDGERAAWKESIRVGRIKVGNGDPVVAVQVDDSTATVYNLTCSPHPNYFVRGLLVHNCWVPDLCRAQQFGQDVEFVKSQGYTVESYRSQYKAMLTITPDNVQSVDDLCKLFPTANP